MASKKNEQIIEIKTPEFITTTIRIEGTSPLLVHEFGDKARKEVLSKQVRPEEKAIGKKEPKNPDGDFINSFYWIEGKPKKEYADLTMEDFHEALDNGARLGFPVTAIKMAANSAAYRNGYVKNQMPLRGSWFIEGETERGLVEIKGSRPVKREDYVRVGMGTADIRFRGEFHNWYMDLPIKILKNGPIKLAQVVNLINLGGFFCGIGEWRPEKDGQHGMFRVAQSSADKA